MKRICALVLAVIMCLSLCACAAHKYVGEYESSYGERLTVHSNGTFTFDTDENWRRSPETYKGTWKEVDGYIVLDSDDESYLKLGKSTFDYPLQLELEGIFLQTSKGTSILEKVS